MVIEIKLRCLERNISDGEYIIIVNTKKIVCGRLKYMNVIIRKIVKTKKNMN